MLINPGFKSAYIIKYKISKMDRFYSKEKNMHYSQIKEISDWHVFFFNLNLVPYLYSVQ